MGPSPHRRWQVDVSYCQEGARQQSIYYPITLRMKQTFRNFMFKKCVYVGKMYALYNVHMPQEYYNFPVYNLCLNS